MQFLNVANYSPCIYFLIDHVIKCFPGATTSSVKASIAQKCKDERKAEAKRRKNAKGCSNLVNMFIF